MCFRRCCSVGEIKISPNCLLSLRFSWHRSAPINSKVSENKNQVQTSQLPIIKPLQSAVKRIVCLSLTYTEIWNSKELSAACRPGFKLVHEQRIQSLPKDKLSRTLNSDLRCCIALLFILTALMKVVKHWNRLPIEVVDAPSLARLNARLDRALGSLIWLKMSLLTAGRWTR